MELKSDLASGVDSETVDDAGASSEMAKPSRTTTVALSGVASAIPAGATQLVPVDGVVRLPAGTRLDAIRVSGANLIITLPDGQILVVVDGALHPPQIILGMISISAANIAALIAGQEPEPAAGAPQSSGGNFSETPGDIGDPFGLGNLLPPTDFGFALSEDEEFIPAGLDNDPVVSIITPDQPLGSTAATATVSEAALAARGAEPAGSDPASNAETVTGTIQIDSPDQPNVVAVNGTAITAVGQTISTPLGVITITSIAPDAIGYSYTLLDNSTNPTASEIITITVTDGDGDIATATLTLAITDDVPTARADTETVAPNLYLAQTGNVITGVGTASGAAGADTLGADGASVTGIRSASATGFTASGTVIQGQYGTLLMLPSGHYSYVRGPGTPGGVADVFTYQLTDGDGDTSTATLTFNIADSPVGLVVPSAGDEGTVVDEAGLSEREGGSPGSRDGDGSNLTFGVITFDTPDGPAIITINGVKVTGVDQEIELPTGTLIIVAINKDSIEYAFVLTDNVAGGASGQSIEVTVSDQDGDSASASFVINILDDVPTAIADTDRLAAGTFGPATGNVITDIENDGGRDTPGADGVTVSAVSGVGGPVTPGTAVSGLYGVLTLNGDGSYSYVRNAGTPGGVSDVFTYTIRDGDGDTSSATLSVFLGDGGVTILVPNGSDAGQQVSEAGLPEGSAPASGTATTSGTFTVSVTDGPGTIFIDGTALTTVGQSFTGSFGTLTITSIGASTIGYSYTLTSPSNGEEVIDDFSLKVVDQDGDQALATIGISITDDVPTASDDADSVQAGSEQGADGNVLTGIGGSDANATDGSADVQGADGAAVTSVSFGGNSGFVDGDTAGNYGTLTLGRDGSYSYQLDNDNADVLALDGTESLIESYEYTITDDDGDESTATLTITIRGKDDIVVIDGLNPEGAEATVAEANLSDGSSPDADALTRTGSFSFDAADGLASLTIGGEALFDGDIVSGVSIATASGTLTITDFDPVYDINGDIVGGIIGYSYELTDNSLLHGGADDGSLTESFAISITDSDGTVAVSSLDVVIVDDIPLAAADEGEVDEGQTLIVDASAGLLANDVAGADDATILGVRALGGDPTGPASGGLGSAIVGLYGTLTVEADGSYSYVVDAGNAELAALDGTQSLSDIFAYTIADGDGDQSTTTLTITIRGKDDIVVIDGLNPEGAEATVAEANLSDGSSPDSDALTRTGSFSFDAADGLASLTIGGEALFDGDIVSGVSIATASGTLTITDFDPVYDINGDIVGGIIGYSYELTDNSLLHGGADDGSLTESFAISITDSDGTVAVSRLDVVVVDDSPSAAADEGEVGEGAVLIVDASAGLLANDVAGADEATILGVRALGGDPASVASGGVGSAIAGLYGTLTVAADGSYSYLSNPNSVPPAGAEDIFVYTLRDGDGDLSTTTLTIYLSDSGLSTTPLELQVEEAALPDGSDPDSLAESVSGDLNDNVAGGTGPFEFALNGDGIGTHGILELNPDGSYTYTLTIAVDGTTANNGNNVVPVVETFTYSVTDALGNTSQNTIVIDVVDDVPTARSAPAITVAEDAPTISGNLLDNDTLGADGASVTSITINGVVIAVPASGTVSYTSAIGSYDFDAEGNWSFNPVSTSSAAALVADFSYTITDGDGDRSTAQQQIRVVDGANPTAGAPISLTLDDQNLESGSAPAMDQPVMVQGDIQFTPGSDPVVSIIFGDLSGLGGELTWTRISDTQIVGFDLDKPVVILDLTVDGNVATVTATLESNYAHHPDSLADDLADLGFINVVATDSDGDQAVGKVSLSVSDDVPSIVTNAPVAGLLTVDETNLAVNATANLGSLFDVTTGSDQPASITYSFTANNGSGLTDVATGSPITLHAMGNVVEGRVAGLAGVVAFRLTIAPNGQATLDQIRAVRHTDATNPDDTVSIPAQLIQLTAVVTDSDGDQASATVNVGALLAFKDDGPSLDIVATDNDTVVLTTQDADTRGAAFDVATANLSSAFAVATANYGADGSNGAAVSWSYTLALGAGAAATGLTSNGVPITLALVAGEIVGSAGGTPVFSVAVNPATGLVTLTQFAEIDHPLPGSASNYDSQLLALPTNLIELRGAATIVDRDGDSISDTTAVDLGGNIRFADHGPSVSAGGEGPVLLLDESFLAVDAAADLSGLFAAALDYGADGAGTVTYQLGVIAGPSGLVDSLTGEAVTLSITGGVIFGRTASQEVFRISVSTAGVVTFDQSRAVIHSPDSGPDQTKFLSGANLITLTATVTDGDGDTAQSTADITGRFAIKDDAPSAINDADSVARDGQIFADGNVLTGLGGVDENGTDGSQDNAGADGGLTVSGVSFGAVAGTLGSALVGGHGSLTLTANGVYRYDLNVNDPAVIALNANETLTDTFTYTVIDADGDSSTATITISITGANDFPIARADTNWVLDGISGSDPSAVGNVLLDINHPGAPAGSFADVADNDPDLEPITVTSAGTYVGLYGTLVIAASGAYTYSLNEDNAAVNALDAGQTLSESFGYTISDGLLTVNSTLTITVFGTNDAPTIGTTTARISEEGLPGGIADSAPNATLDTTNSVAFSGTLAIGDLDAGEILTATLGNPGAVLTAGGVAVTWSGVGTGTLIGSAGGNEVIRVTLASNGAYTVTLSRAVDHPVVALEDQKEFTVPVSVSDGTVTTTNASAIRVVIEDDAPTATGETGASAQVQQDVNTLFILDFSESIDDGELDTMLDAVKNALTLLDSSALSALTIKFVIFSSLSFASPAFTSAADANAYLDSLNPADGGTRPDSIGGNTNYSSAINTALANFSAMPGASNQVFFLSDGNPNQGVQFSPPNPPNIPVVVNSLTNATAANWNNFVDSNDVNVTVIGIDKDPTGPLQIQRLRDVDLNDAPDNQPIVVEDFDDLVATLLAVVVPAAVGGDLDANDAYGADGGRLLSITVGSTTYTWDGASSISVSSGGTIAGSILTATTPQGGTLQLNFANGQYNYQPPSPITVTATEVFSYTIVDKDGDTATAALSVTITALAPPVVLDLDGDGVEFVSSAAGVLFDYNGDGVAESTAWVSSDDGLLVLDSNGNGKVDNGSEIVFGHGGLTDLQGLAASHDSNGDGVLSSADASFSKFGVWRDLNSNGVTDAGELVSLSQAGIASISLVSDGRSYTAAGGEVIVRGEAVYTKVNGETGKLADAAFATNFANGAKRVLSPTESNGLATAMAVATMVTALPLAAEDRAVPLSVDATFADTVSVAANQMIEPLQVERVEDPEFWFDQSADRTGSSTTDEPSTNQVEDGYRDVFNGRLELDARTELVSTSGTEEQIGEGSVPTAMSTSADQVLLLTPSQQIGVELTADEINVLVADAIEGRTIDLDSLLAAYVGPDRGQQPMLLHNDASQGFLAEYSMSVSGDIFMPDLADQQVLAQMEQAANAGHT